MSEPVTKKRRRLNPEVRRTMIMQCAADIVAREGVANLSMERIGKEAGVSKSLVYTYFENLTELLKQLLEQELLALRRLQYDAAENAETFEDLVRQVTHQYLTYIEDRGLIIERLQSEPSISSDHDPTDYGRDAAVTYLAKMFSYHFDLPIETARAATDISFGLPAAAGVYLLKSKADRQEVEELTTKMIIGSLLSVTNDRLTKRLPLRRK